MFCVDIKKKRLKGVTCFYVRHTTLILKASKMSYKNVKHKELQSETYFNFQI